MSYNCTANQRRILLEALLKKPMSTIEIRRDLDIIAPAPRIYELRHSEGQNIQMHWSKEPTECGRVHRVGRYVLFTNAQNEAATFTGA